MMGKINHQILGNERIPAFTSWIDLARQNCTPKLTFLTMLCILLLASLAPWQAVLAAPVTYVRSDGHDTLCDGTVDAMYPGNGGPYACAKQSVQAGIDAADTGGSVIIRAGTYGANITIAKNLTLSGDGSDLTFIDGGGTTPGLTIDVGVSVEVRNLSVQHAVNALSGGGIRNLGTLILEDCIIQNNSATAGGGIFSDQSISISRCVVQGNSASDGPGGGGLFIEGPMDMQDVTVRDNHAVAWGAGGGGILLHNSAGEAVTIRRTAINANTAPVGGEFSGGGAGIFLYGDELVYFGNVTVTDNTADFSGAGVKAFINGSGYFQNSTIAGNHNVFNGGVEVYGGSSSLTFINTIVASNDGSQCNIVSGTIYTNGRNISSDTSCGFTFKGDMQNTDPLLGPLGDNGGPTQTMALLSGSPAIDTGGNTICDFIYVGGVDQRGWARPIDGDLDGSPICDIGAFEAAPPYQLWLPLIVR